MNKQEEFDESRLKNNPFTYTLQIPVTKVISDIDYAMDIEDGIFHNKAFYLEKVKKTSIYHCESCKEITLGLSDKALRLYTWIYMSITPGKDFIRLNKELYMKRTNTKSINTYKAAIAELIRYCYITQTEYRTVYYINPNIFFSGNRLNKYPNRIVETNKWEK